jgi:hypothetical protein
MMRDRFYDASSGAFYFTEAGATDLIVRQIVGSDSPLPSGNGVAAMGFLELKDAGAARGVISEFAAQMEGVGDNMSALLQAALVYVRRHGTFTVEGQKTSERPKSPGELAGSVVEIEAGWQGAELRVRCRVADGYHLNSHDAEVEPTHLTATGGEIAEVIYPPGELHGEFEILVRFKTRPEKAFAINLRYQACDDNSCLPAVTRTVQIAVPD